MRLSECVAALRELGPEAKITLEARDRPPIRMTLDGGTLVVANDQGEAYRVSFASGTARVFRSADTRDPTNDCLQKCYDECGGTALCMDKCALKCL